MHKLTYRRILYILSILLLSSYWSYSQRNCGFTQYQEFLESKYGIGQDEKTFENWLSEQIQDSRSRNAASGFTEAEVYTIPVVVHVIHNGESLGEGANIPDGQIISQIDTLNRDFRRLNGDASNTPDDFIPVASDAMIEFVLAKRDPEGLPTTGIVRKRGSRTSYSTSTSDELAADSQWPSDEYLNIWVCNISGGLLGYAQFPVSNLEGMDEQQTINPYTDGVVVDWEYFGTGFNARDFSKGRTGTHEIGHYLGLRHIHGDLGCDKDDFCDDTPLKSGRTDGCPPAGSEESCGSIDMFQNYMNLSDDVCMNLFTVCQVGRMRAILEVSPRRRTLLNSKGGLEPVLVANDIGIRQILSPLSGDCGDVVTPQIEIRNYGTNTVTQHEIELYIDDVLRETLNSTTNLVEQGTNLVTFSPLTAEMGTSSTYRFVVTTANEVNDGNSDNNEMSTIASFPNQDAIPNFEDFESGTTTWNIYNHDNTPVAWTIDNAPKDIFENVGAVLNYHNSPVERYGQLDYITSPVLDLSALPAVDVSFKYAHAPLPGNITDVLTVAVSTDCGQTFPESNIIFQRFSPNLGTATSTSEFYVPEGPDDWEEVNINITEFTGFSEVVIGFIGHNGGGNNIYLDDIELTTDNLLAYNIGITEVNSFPVTTCFNTIFPTVEVKNFGFETITDFDLEYTFNGVTETENVSNTIVLPGKTKSVLVQLSNVDPGTYNASFTVSNPNGNLDEQPVNDSFTANIRLNNTEEVIPLREQFKTSIENSDWTFIRPDADHNWSIENVQGNGDGNAALFFNGFNTSELGIENWLVSPVIDLSALEEASMFFKVSYANNGNRNDRLRVYLSTSCGQTFDQVIYDKKGEDLAVKPETEEWFPQTSDDWRTEFIDLTEYTIWPDARIAFVVTNQNGNNIFIDDIEFFTSSNPEPLDIGNDAIRLYPNPATTLVNIKLDLNNRTDLELRLSNLTGEVVFKDFLPNSLNQVFSINNLDLKNGVYIINITGSGTNLSRRIWINR